MVFCVLLPRKEGYAGTGDFFSTSLFQLSTAATRDRHYVAATRSSASAKESPERLEHAPRERKRFLRPIRRLLRKRPLRTAVHLTRSSWYFVDRQIDVVSGAGCRATGGGELI